MKSEDFFCERGKHKWPTPEQFEEEYGHAPVDTACYVLCTFCEEGVVKQEWVSVDWEEKDFLPDKIAVIACTPYGRPPLEYRPNSEKSS
jgi:hypothetical protein